ncbi:MAG TPA: DUF6350 family protein [Candidatus Nanopelagicaceae bacterium]
MFQRVLWVSLTQALRSVALFLLPTAFLALLAWATAGSTNGNTSDPIRVAMWIWLGAHHVPFQLVLPPSGASGFLSYLPWGALVFPFLAARNGFSRVKSHLDIAERSLQLSRILFSVFYTLIALLIAWGSRTTSVTPILYWVPLTTLPGIWFVTGTVRSRTREKAISPLRISSRLLALGLGLSSIVLGIALFLHLTTVENLTFVLQPGWLGGVLFLFLNILYLPNAIVATLSYLAGPGYAVGAHTLLAPLSHTISEIPALPILGALPTGRHPLVLISTVIFFFAGVVLYHWTITQSSQVLLKSYLVIVIGVGLISFLSSGGLLTDAMGAMGVSAWKLTSAIAAEVGLGILVAFAVPRILGSVRSPK